MSFLLSVYEAIAQGKQKEQTHANVLRQIVPGLEQPYAGLLMEWERLFAKTRERALAAAASREADADAGLLEDAQAQSREFERQLGLLQEHSAAVRRMAGSASLLEMMRSSWSNPLGDPAGTPAHQSAAVVGTSGSAARAVPIGGHTLPPLPYAYNALEPWIDEKTMRIHHDKHHQSYVDGLNKAEKKLAEARKSGDFDLVKHWERELAFNGAGHYLHTIFWDAMAPKGGGQPSGPLAEELSRSFGSYDAFKKQFSEAANKVEGGGWAILVWSPRSRRLEILTAEKHQNLSQWDVVPLLPLDVWEHAYYLKHQNDRAAYVKDWWNVVNWPYVADRFAKARTLQWTPH